jgi:predicted enzyme related to lactoylglutathione lyase
MSAMQEMLLNMILPKEEQEQLKKALTPENIKAFINSVTTGYKDLKDQLNRIEAQNAQILEAMNSGPGRGRRLSIASGNGGGTDASERTGTDN